MKMRAMGFVLLAMLGATSWGAVDEQRGWTIIVQLGPGEMVEHVWFLTAPPPADVQTQADCEGAEFDVTFSDPLGQVAPVTEHVSLSLTQPLAKASATFAGFGKFVVALQSNEEKRGACKIRRRTRIVGDDGRTAAEGGGFDSSGEDVVDELLKAPRELILSVGDVSETLHKVFFAKYSGTEVKLESACPSVEFDVTTSEPMGLVAHEVTHVSLTPDAPLYEVDARFADFGEVILMEISNVSVQGNCEVLTGERVADEQGRTVASGYGNHRVIWLD